MTNAPAARTSDFLDTLGVDTHLSYTDGGYANISNVTADLRYLGIAHVRDSLSNPAHLASYIALARQGVTFTLTIKGQSQTTATLNASLALAQNLMQAVPGSVTAIEGANEINNWPVTYNGVGGLQGAVELQKDLYAAVHGNPAFAGVAVDYFTGYAAGGVAAGPNPATTAGLADFDTQHPYPVNGNAPAASINPANAANNETGGQTGPVVYTETGYSSNGGMAGAVDQQVQAKYTLDLLLDAMKDGVAQVDLYDLLDAYAPGSAQGDDGYGLFGPDNSPKLAATAIHNLTSILADRGPNAASFKTGTLTPILTGLPATGQDLVLEKSNGAFDIVVWAEPQIWNKALGTEVAAATQTVSIDLGAAYGSVAVYDPLLGTAPIATSSNTETVRIGVSDHPLIIEVAGGVLTTVKGMTAAAVGATVADTAQNIMAGLASLQARASSIASITLTGGTMTVGAGMAVADQAALDKVAGGFAVSDTAVAILPVLGTLASDSHVTGITVRSGSVDVSAATYLADRAALDKLSVRFGITDAAGNLAAASAAIAADKTVGSVTTTACGQAVAQALYNADGSLASLATMTRDAAGDVVTHVASGSVLGGKSYSSYDDVKSASGQFLSRTTYAASGTATGQTLYNADGSVYSNRTITVDAAGDTLSHYSGGSSLHGSAYTATDTLTDGSGTLLYTAQTIGNNAAHAFQVTASNLTVSASFNDTFDVSGQNDTIVFVHGFGHDTFVGYVPGDTLSFSKNLFANYATLLNSATGTTDTTLSDSHGNTVLMKGVSLSHLSADMFKFT